MAISDAEWKLLSDLFHDRFGLVFEGIRRSFLEPRLAPRLRDLRLASYREYYHYLLFHPQREGEIGQLKVLLTNNETYFFRESHQLALLTNHLVPALMPRLEGRPLRVLSAGCSSGEETYSIVMQLQNAGLELRGVTWQVDGCDLNPRRLATAREAVYDANSMRGVPQEVRERHFDMVDLRFALRERHKKGVRFFEANLVDPAAGIGWGPYDVIFCRNVLIYFSESSFDAAISALARCLARGGTLMLGHSESLIDRRSDFVPICIDGSIVYRKAGA